VHRQAVAGGSEVHDRIVLSAILELRRGVPLGSRVTPGVPEFTQRETELLSLMMSGLLDTSQLADRMFITPNTVKTDVERVFSKFGVSNLAAAVTRAYEIGLGENFGATRVNR
jgi:DNA-binding CsgD family transcriptional regulator